MTQTARLTSALLARKGQAFPTGGFACPTIDLGQPLPAPGKLRPRRGVVLARSTPERAGGALATQLRRLRRPPSQGDDGRVALTLRLDRARHRRLRIFAARHDRTCQEVILRALDIYLEASGADCACLSSGLEGCAGS
ncbi:MAG TPA: hypothetical protein VLE23_18035 [Geminicoccaceae bacterium]|nr:hypothetical protein [Geminicoccaceae bacterium]